MKQIVGIWHNQRGAALWSVLLISFILLFIITSSVSYIVEHKSVLKMRLQQMQAGELVKNGVAYLKAKIASNEDFESHSYTEHYVNGRVEMKIIEVNELLVHAIISGYPQSDQLQSYEVKIDRVENKVIHYTKTVLGTE